MDEHFCGQCNREITEHEKVVNGGLCEWCAERRSVANEEQDVDEVDIDINGDEFKRLVQLEKENEIRAKGGR